MQNVRLSLTVENLARLAVLNGYEGVEDLAKAIGRTRQTVHEAILRPHRFGPTIDLINKALPVRTAPARRLIAA